MTIQTYFTQTFQQSSNIVTATAAPANTNLLQIVDSVGAGDTLSGLACSYLVTGTTAIYVWCDTAGVTMTPNTGASAVLTFSNPLIPFVWLSGNPAANANPWSANFASLTVDNSGGATTANFQICVLS